MGVRSARRSSFRPGYVKAGKKFLRGARGGSDGRTKRLRTWSRPAMRPAAPHRSPSQKARSRARGSSTTFEVASKRMTDRTLETAARAAGRGGLALDLPLPPRGAGRRAASGGRNSGRSGVDPEDVPRSLAAPSKNRVKGPWVVIIGNSADPERRRWRAEEPVRAGPAAVPTRRVAVPEALPPRRQRRHGGFPIPLFRRAHREHRLRTWPVAAAIVHAASLWRFE